MRAVFGITAHELDRLRHHIDRFRPIDRDPILRFQPEDPSHHQLPYTFDTASLESEWRLRNLCVQGKSIGESL